MKQQQGGGREIMRKTCTHCNDCGQRTQEKKVQNFFKGSVHYGSVSILQVFRRKQ